MADQNLIISATFASSQILPVSKETAKSAFKAPPAEAVNVEISSEAQEKYNGSCEGCSEKSSAQVTQDLARDKVAGASQELSVQEEKVVSALRTRDTAVKAHEAAHLAAAGPLARGGASFSYQVGPDGHRYAVGGEVSIDTSEGQTPEETIRKAQIIRAAATAPASPSGQDRAVAAYASQMEAKARQELFQENAELAKAVLVKDQQLVGLQNDKGSKIDEAF